MPPAWSNLKQTSGGKTMLKKIGLLSAVLFAAVTLASCVTAGGYGYGRGYRYGYPDSSGYGWRNGYQAYPYGGSLRRDRREHERLEREERRYRRDGRRYRDYRY